MNIFDSIRNYDIKWVVKSIRPFDPEEVEQVEKAIVVPSRYGPTVQITMKRGAVTFIPLSKDSTLTVGAEIDLSKAQVVILTKPGENDVMRILA